MTNEGTRELSGGGQGTREGGRSAEEQGKQGDVVKPLASEEMLATTAVSLASLKTSAVKEDVKGRRLQGPYEARGY
ncbi:UNVERIFIED_CONTAM: hypothetical protein HHA_452540 [Hammondia hammondi]|eukprot:XP_008885650.1 hypothetical protein HHA_452540 [Hammondia hammondi]